MYEGRRSCPNGGVASCKNYDRLTERAGATKELCERRASSVRQGYLNRQICPLPVTRRPGVGLAEGRRRETYFPALV